MFQKRIFSVDASSLHFPNSKEILFYVKLDTVLGDKKHSTVLNAKVK